MSEYTLTGRQDWERYADALVAGIPEAPDARKALVQVVNGVSTAHTIGWCLSIPGVFGSLWLASEGQWAMATWLSGACFGGALLAIRHAMYALRRQVKAAEYQIRCVAEAMPPDMPEHLDALVRKHQGWIKLCEEFRDV